MAAFSEMHIHADRFAEYVAELRAFSGTYRVACGAPEDLAPLVRALRKSQTFALDFGSMLRSIVLNEHFQASDAELLILVAVAWGGATADDSMDQLPPIFQDLGKIIQDVLHRSAIDPIPPPALEGEANATSSDENATEELADLNPDVQVHRQLVDPKNSHEGWPQRQRDAPSHRPVSGERLALVPQVEPTTSGPDREKVPQISRAQDFSSPSASRRFLVEEESPNESSVPVVVGRSGEHLRLFPTRRPELKPTEVAATALTGLVVALLLYMPSLPVYRSRVSVYLPSAPATTTDPGSSSNPFLPTSPETSLRDGRLAGRVAERLLLRPHGNPILRQDAISRGLRDLHLGGMEPILYANLVAETNQQIKVRRVEPQNLYEITCDSWSPQFSATFCNELIAGLEEQTSSTSASHAAGDSVRTVDAATGPGIQVYPRWFLVGFVGLACGILAGFLVGFSKRSKPESVADGESAHQ